MNQQADFVGELALRVVSRGGTGVVTRVFPGAVYVRARDDILLLLWGSLKSPMTVNLPGGRSTSGAYEVGERFDLSAKGLESKGGAISVKGSPVHRGSLREKREIALPAAADLVKGVAMIRSMYDVSASERVLARDRAFDAFVRQSLSPFAKGGSENVSEFRTYRELVGRGVGFTPAGDDFVAGFAGTLNFIARCRGSLRMSVPRKSVLSKTIPESGAMVAYASMGYLDETMESLVLASLDRAQNGFYRELLSVVSRGHTSGVDMALGVLMCEAASAERERRDGTFERCVRAL